ncbi:MAG TPA: 50S ribosomal protein L25 [Microthrixaceae bacterium]|nr:50S ribosomal protein L25 [Microthrixaceae bacterium]
MSEVTLTAAVGRKTGTSDSRRARLENNVPGVVYGAGKPSLSISLVRSELRRAMTTGAGSNALVTLTVDGETDQVLVREVQRHPVRRDVIHIDFMRINPTKPVELEVPIILVGEPKQVTVNGGMTEQRLNKLKVRVRPDAIPNSIEVDISGMTLDRSLLVKDLNLPEGSVCLSKPQQAVVTAELTRAAVVSRGSADADGEEASEA